MKLQLDKRQKLLKIVPKQEIKVIEDAKKTRDDKIAYAIRLRDESGTLNKERSGSRLLRKRIVNIITRFQQQEISIRGNCG